MKQLLKNVGLALLAPIVWFTETFLTAWAVTNRNSDVLTNTAATPRVINNRIVSTAVVKEAIGLVTPAADDSATSIHRYFRVKSNCRMTALRLTCAIASSAGAVDIGLYRTAEDGGAEVDKDFFASAQSLSAAALSDADVMNESTTYTLAKQMQPLWQAVGLSADPQCDFDVCTTISTTFNGGPTSMLLKGRFVD
jgi:hypothetical protein